MKNLTKATLSLTALAPFVGVGCQSSTKATASSSTTETSGPPTRAASKTNPDVTIVRNGMLARYNSTTVGKAFEGTFENAKWTTFETPKSVTIVEFDGTIKYRNPPPLSYKVNFMGVSERQLLQSASRS